MKIGFTGAHSSGKTSLARFVADRYSLNNLSNFVLSHFSPKHGFPENTEQCQNLLLGCWQETVSERTNLVIDRTPLDMFIYAHIFKCCPPDYLSKVLESLSFLDYIFITQPVVYVDGQKYRYDEKSQSQYQRLMTLTLGRTFGLLTQDNGKDLCVKSFRYRNKVFRLAVLPPVSLMELKSQVRIFLDKIYVNKKEGKVI